MVHKVMQLCLCLIILTTLDADKGCPETNPEEPELIPDKKDCTKFYICDSGVAYSQNCSADLYFNPTLEVCDHPENVVFCEYDDFVYIKAHCECNKYVICNYGVVEVKDCGQGYHYSVSPVQISNYYTPCDAGDCYE